MLSRRKMLVGSGAAVAAGGTLVASSFLGMGSAKSYADAIASQRAQLTPQEGLRGAIRYATLAANGHNTQPSRLSPVIPASGPISSCASALVLNCRSQRAGRSKR